MSGPMPSAKTIDGRAIAARLWDEVEQDARQFHARYGVKAQLVAVQVGEDPATSSYFRQIARSFKAHELSVRIDQLPLPVSNHQVADHLRALGEDPLVHGVLIQSPLPTPLDLLSAIQGLPPVKDVEGLHPLNAGLLLEGRPHFVPTTALAGMEVVRAEGVDVTGRHAVVVGRSIIVGRPLALLLLHANATVTICHSRTADLPTITRQADILAVAVGIPGLVTGEMVKPGAVVLDFGTNVTEAGLVGDVDFASVQQVASAITPVPGGIGPVTTAALGRATLQAAKEQLATAPSG